MKSNKFLIVIDMQNDFVSGPLGTPEARAIIPNVVKKIEKYRNYDADIIFTKDTHYDNYLNTQEGLNLPIEHCKHLSFGWKLIPEISFIGTPLDIIVNKNQFGVGRWHEILPKNTSQIELIGLCTDICVISNALILKTQFPEALISVDASCCAGITPETHKKALEIMKMNQIKVIGE